MKKLFFRTNSSNLMMFVTEISVRSVRVTSCCNFSRTICKARSTGMDVNNATTLNDTMISSSVIGWSLTCWANTTLFVTEYFSFSSGDKIETKCRDTCAYMCLYVPICLDMRQASQAAQSEKHPMPIIEETLQGTPKIYISWNQLEYFLFTKYYKNLNYKFVGAC